MTELSRETRSEPENGDANASKRVYSNDWPVAPARRNAQRILFFLSRSLCRAFAQFDAREEKGELLDLTFPTSDRSRGPRAIIYCLAVFSSLSRERAGERWRVLFFERPARRERASIYGAFCLVFFSAARNFFNFVACN